MLNKLLLLLLVLTAFSLWSQNALDSSQPNLLPEEQLSQTASQASISNINGLLAFQFQSKANQESENLKKAKNSNNKITKSVSHPFRIPNWSFFGYLLFSGIAIYLYSQYRMKKVYQQLKKLEEFKINISSELHDQVGSILSGIAMESEYLSLQKKNIPKEDMKKIGNRTRDAMERMRDIVWSLDSQKNSYNHLVEKMKDLAQVTFSNSRFEFSFHSEGNLKTSLIQQEIKKSVFYIYREAITNILKHSNGNEVEIEFSKLQRELVLKIKDNGSFQIKKFDTGQGLHNMILRVKELGGQIIFNTKEGFELIIIVPLKMNKLWSAN